MSSIRKRYNNKTKKYSYQAIIEIGKDNNGKRCREYRTFDNKKDAELYLKETDVQISQNSHVRNNKLTVSQVATYWIRYLENKDIKYNTLRGYKVNVNNHIIPSIGNIYIQKLTSYNINDMIDDLKKKGLGATSIRYVLRNLNGIIEFSIKRQWLKNSPMSEVDRPRPKPFKSQPYSKEELKRLIDVSKGTDFEYIIRIEAETGLRIGELLALTWSDIDFINNTISINKTIVYKVGKGCTSSSPKSEKSNRTIPVTEDLIIALEDFKKSEIKKLKDFKKGSIINSKTIIHDKNWEPKSPHSVSLAFSKFLENNNLRHIRFHDLRHTHASLLYLDYDTDIIAIRDRMGHSRASTTINSYVTGTYKQQLEGITKLNSSLNNENDRILN